MRFDRIHRKSVYVFTLLALLICTLTLLFPNRAEAHFGQYGGDPCIACHTAVDIQAATLYIGVDGVDESPENGGDLTVTANPGDPIEFDFYFTGVKGTGNDDGVGVLIQRPATDWTILPATGGGAGTEPAGWAGTWSSSWNSASGVSWIEVPNDPLFYTINFDTTGWDYGNADVACDDPGACTDLDGQLDTMGSDFIINVPVTASGPYVISVYAVGHDDTIGGGGRASEFRDITINVNAPDVFAPTVTAFTATSPSVSLDIPIPTFTADDNVGVTGYLITESATPPLPTNPGWTGSAPATYTVASDGTYTLYPWAKDAADNVSAVYATPATVDVDTTAPSVTTTTPANGATGVALDSNVTIDWDENIDCATVNTTNITSDSPGWTFSTCSGSQAVFTTAGQANSTTYNVNITTAVTDTAGNPMAAAYPFSYTTDVGAGGQELVINPEFNTGANWTITLEATESGLGTFQYDAATTHTADGSGSVTGHEEGVNNRVIGTVTQQVSVPAGSTINSASIWSQLSTTHDITGDSIRIDLRYDDATIPADGETGVPLNSTVTINWGENLDCTTVNTANITSDSPGWTLSTCSGSQAVFTTAGQTNNMTYTVTITTAVTDSAGNGMTSSYVFSYTTTP